jgi:probable selenium-dependent hydroxylase accessory protein YqeC
MERPDLLYSALGLRRADLVAFVGGGGKTAAILTLAEELSHRDWRVLVSTTTRVGPRISEAMPTVAMLGDEPPESLASTINETRRAFLYAARDSEGKFVGPDPWSIAALRERGLADILLVEADGARHMPLKAPGEHEPRIPGSADVVVPAAGLDAIGLPIEEGRVHRPELVRRIAPADTVTPEVVAAVLTDPSGGLKDVPNHARVVALLNKADRVPEEVSRRTASRILALGSGSVERVVVASIRDGRYSVLVR